VLRLAHPDATSAVKASPIPTLTQLLRRIRISSL
jgi:hypothetical protein